MLASVAITATGRDPGMRTVLSAAGSTTPKAGIRNFLRISGALPDTVPQAAITALQFCSAMNSRFCTAIIRTCSLVLLPYGIRPVSPK